MVDWCQGQPWPTCVALHCLLCMRLSPARGPPQGAGHRRASAQHPDCFFTPSAPCTSLLQAQGAEELANAALALSHYQAATDADEVDLDLIESLLSYICEVRLVWRAVLAA